MNQPDHATPADEITAMAALGARLLSGTEREIDPRRGAELLSAAADRGSGEAAALVAVMAAAGVCRPQSWEQALDSLQRAAELGFEPARQQLLLLGGGGQAAAGPAPWQALRQRIDLAAWLTPPVKQTLCESPKVRRIENFIPAAVCDWMIGRARGKLQRARVYAAGGEAQLEAGRTNSETDFNIVEADVVLTLLRARIGIATGLPPAVMELTKVLHYQPGERFERHYDFIDPAEPGFAQELAVRGQRIATFLVYLNDDYDGGETDFPALGLCHKGRKGDALMFANVDAGQPDRRTLHAGLPPVRGEKWLLSQWIRDRAPAGR
jgi:hypothetical protein